MGVCVTPGRGYSFVVVSCGWCVCVCVYVGQRGFGWDISSECLMQGLRTQHKCRGSKDMEQMEPNNQPTNKINLHR
jgi:hypothetical protein